MANNSIIPVNGLPWLNPPVGPQPVTSGAVMQPQATAAAPALPVMPQSPPANAQATAVPTGGVAPTSPKEFEERKSGWTGFFQNLQSNPNMQRLLLAYGANALQPMAPGQTALGHNAMALLKGVQYANVAGAQARKAKAEERKLQVEEMDAKTRRASQESNAELNKARSMSLAEQVKLAKDKFGLERTNSNRDWQINLDKVQLESRKFELAAEQLGLRREMFDSDAEHKAESRKLQKALVDVKKRMAKVAEAGIETDKVRAGAAKTSADAAMIKANKDTSGVIVKENLEDGGWLVVDKQNGTPKYAIDANYKVREFTAGGKKADAASVEWTSEKIAKAREALERRREAGQVSNEVYQDLTKQLDAQEAALTDPKGGAGDDLLDMLTPSRNNSGAGRRPK